MHIILDLDETCVSSLEYANAKTCKCTAPSFIIYDDVTKQPLYKTFMRPKLEQFLKWAFANHQVSFWSAGEKCYVLDIIAHILPPNCTPTMILWNTQCEMCTQETTCLKNIQWLKDKIPDSKLFENAVLVDDLEANVFNNPMYSIQIGEFDMSKEESVLNSDDELERVRTQIEQLESTAQIDGDVRKM